MSYLEYIVKEEVLFLQRLGTEFLGVSWLEIVDHIFMYKIPLLKICFRLGGTGIRVIVVC